MKAVVLSGSSRSNNNTWRVALAFERLLRANGVEVELIDFKEYDIPFMNQGELSGEGDSAFQKKLIRSWKDATLIITISPEYNWFPSAELVNMIHQLGSRAFGDLFDDKVFAFSGVSTGRGGRLPALQLSSVYEKVIAFLHKHSVISPKKFEGHYITRELDEKGNFLLDDGFEQAMQRFVEYNVQLAVKLS